MALLVLIRHGESEWNLKGTWTGITDVNLTDLGWQQARDAGKKLIGLSFDVAYTSVLKRAIDTLTGVLEGMGVSSVQTIQNAALNERDYGIYTGQNKWEVKAKYGDEVFMGIRRGWDYPIPEGESLKQVSDRVVPYYESTILPELRAGKNVVITAHGNSLRALIKHIEHISDADIPHLELATGEVYKYDINPDGSVKEKTILK